MSAPASMPEVTRTPPSSGALWTSRNFTVPLALTMLSTTHYSDMPAVMLATLLGLVPVFILFALLSRQFIAGLTSGAVK